MSYFRSYFEKNNTIIKDMQVNTAKNPTTEIFYGSGFSKFLFKVDFTELKRRVDNNEVIVDSNTKHTLHLTNTIFGDEGLKGENRTTGRDRATSFDLILFQIPEDEYWDEGIGFDYQNESYDFVSGNKTYDERPSNWFYRNTLDQWSTVGVYNDSPTIVAGTSGSVIHFDNGFENIDFDITDYVNSILVSGATDQGLGLAFAVVYSQLSPDVDQSVAFFTKYTQTFFEPYVESYFDDTIMDNRDNFVEQLEQNLYLYVSQGTNCINLDLMPVVDITDSNGNVISGLSNLDVTHVRCGVYKVTFGIENVTCDGKRFYYDKWKNLQINQVALADVSQKFVPYPITNQIKIGGNETQFTRYAVQYYGLRLNEKLQSGEKRKVVVSFRDINNPRTVLLDNVFYRIWVDEGGHIQVPIHEWTLMDKSNENSFMIDTTYLIPREYYLEFKAIVNNEEIMYKDTIKFEIVSEK
jgi:hypothetical protein